MKKMTLAVLTTALALSLVFLACSKGPAPPQLIYPQDRAILLNMPFVWSSVPEAENYLFEIAIDETFGTSVIEEELTDTTYQIQTPEEFEPDIQYYWHVYSGDGKNWGNASESRSFTLAGGGKP